MDPLTEEIVTAILATILLFSGYGLRVLVESHRAKAAASQPPKAICPCGHVVSVHAKGGTGKCTSSARRQYYELGGSRSGWEWVPCDCLEYMGPELLRDVIGRGVSADESTNIPRHRYEHI